MYCKNKRKCIKFNTRRNKKTKTKTKTKMRMNILYVQNNVLMNLYIVITIKGHLEC